MIIIISIVINIIIIITPKIQVMLIDTAVPVCIKNTSHVEART